MLNGGTFFVFIFFAVIAYLIFLTPSHEKEPKEPQEKTNLTSIWAYLLFSFHQPHPFLPLLLLSPHQQPLQPLLLSSKTMPLPSSTIVQSKKRL